ncbi:N-acetylglucosamine-6-phosphate deacetylase [Cytobacillus sp. Hz8]|uniref:N-acetylglucosamine-6-phosphate deacetylase n=1 Tax=Cytobacillus sp. Hz8 TaxID=3347168 RepID=UPI0035E21F5C
MAAEQGFGIFKGVEYCTNKPIILKTNNGRIVKKLDGTGNNSDNLPWIAPGLVDLQINGYSGIDFNTLPLSFESVHKATEILWKEGVTQYIPTVITNSPERIETILEIISKAIESDESRHTIAGIHLEGPFLSPEDGPRGAHDAAYIRPPEWEMFVKWQKAARGHIRILTLSPEWQNSPNFIKKCVESGVKVSIGHTAANSEQISLAVKAGASLSTHLGNGAHAKLPRHPNYIWDQLADDRLWAGMIGDGFHLPASVLKVIRKVKESHTILVSDSVNLAGLSPGVYHTHVGGKVVLTPEGKLHLAESPDLLAGSVKSLRKGIENLINMGVCSFQEAWEMSSLHPSTFLGLQTKDGLKVGSPADFVLFNRNKNEIQVIQTIKNGEIVFNGLKVEKN